MKKALILNISHNDLGQIRALKQLGYYVIGTGNNPQLPGRMLVDRYIPEDYSDKDAILRIATDNSIDAICSCCNDFGVITAAYVAEKMGLPGHDTYETAKTIHHKNLFKEFTRAHGIPSPVSHCFAQKEEAVEWVKEHGKYPLMIKPVDLTGGKGCARTENLSSSISAIAQAFQISRCKRIVVEPFIVGSQHACCTFLVDKRVRAICTNDEYSITNPYKVEVDTYPATGFEPIRDLMIRLIERMAVALDLKDGIFHIQYIMQEGKPYIIEAMRRILGNLYMLPAMKLTGLDWDYWETRAQCGLPLDGFPTSLKQEGYWAYRCVMGNKKGIVHDVVIPQEFRQYMFDKFEMWHENDVVEDVLNTQLGFYFFQFPNAEKMKEMMVDRYSDIHVAYDK